MTVTESNPSTTIDSPTEEHAPADREMTMLEHLQELRTRLVAAVLSVVVGVLVAIIPIPGFDSITHFVIKLLTAAAPTEKLLVLGPGEGFFVYLEVALMLGVALSMPVIIYQVLAFVAPALYSNEKRYLYIAAPGATLSFLVGVLFCYYFMLPFAIAFLGNFATDVFSAQWAAQRYLDFVTTFVFWVGVTFELPIVMYFLAKLGVVKPESMAKFRRYAFVLSFVIGAIITPTPDPINQSMVSFPIYLLFELGIILARFA
jgi:sec-independent protein translocase protein TatC